MKSCQQLCALTFLPAYLKDFLAYTAQHSTNHYASQAPKVSNKNEKWKDIIFFEKFICVFFLLYFLLNHYNRRCCNGERVRSNNLGAFIDPIQTRNSLLFARFVFNFYLFRLTTKSFHIAYVKWNQGTTFYHNNEYIAYKYSNIKQWVVEDVQKVSCLEWGMQCQKCTRRVPVFPVVTLSTSVCQFCVASKIFVKYVTLANDDTAYKFRSMRS